LKRSMSNDAHGTSRREERAAVLALLLGTVCWGCGFTWAKEAGEAVQHAAGLPAGHPFGPIFVLAWRFLRERLAVHQWVGVGVVLLGILLVSV